MRLEGRWSRISGVTVVPRMGLQRQLLLAKALRGERCAAECAMAAVGMRVEGEEKMRVGGMVGVVVVDDVWCVISKVR